MRFSALPLANVARDRDEQLEALPANLLDGRGNLDLPELIAVP